MTVREFTSLDRFDITGRGTLYVVDLPDDLWSAPHAPKLVDTTVRIDGDLYVVKGVETPAIHWRPSSNAFRTVGLLARRLTVQPVTDDDIEDAVFIAELQRRIARDNGNRIIPFDEVLARLGITREELEDGG